MLRVPVSCLVSVLWMLVFSTASGALVFDATSTDDNPDAVIDGTCADAEGACTLRAAVQEANANVDPTPDEINVPAGKYVLKETGPDEDAAATCDLDLTDPVNISGAGAESTVVQGKKDRVFEVPVGATALITDLTVTKGSIGTRKRVKADEIFNGGGISNEGTFALERVSLSKNKSADDGGGLSNVFGTLVLTDVLLTGNKAKDDAGALEHNGGATPTHALAPDSPAVDMGTQTGCPAEDQRGLARDDGACDVGAFEL